MKRIRGPENWDKRNRNSETMKFFFLTIVHKTRPCVGRYLSSIHHKFWVYEGFRQKNRKLYRNKKSKLLVLGVCVEIYIFLAKIFPRDFKKTRRNHMKSQEILAFILSHSLKMSLLCLSTRWQTSVDSAYAIEERFMVGNVI